MPEVKFQLNNYTHQILRIADRQGCTTDVALQCFIANLTTMKEHYEGADGLNYHELGQQWNKLLSKEKVAQKAETRARLTKYPRSGGKA